VEFLSLWHDAAMTSLGWFWTALWAFVLGYAISACIQVFVTRERMRRMLGEDGVRSVGLASVFGVISSSCSFSALSTTRALFRKGAGFIASLAFLLASTNLVIELGVVIAVFLSWHFVVGEYVGGVLLIVLMAAVVSLTRPRRWIAEARERGEDHDHHAHGDDDEDELPPVMDRLTSLHGWRQVARTYHGEWKMVWKDVLIGFTVAGLISVFVPDAFFAWLFPGTGQEGELAVWQVVVQALVAPLAAFFTFIGSMGNVPLAAVLFERGVSFAGVMAFLFSDLVVLPALRIQARYHGWRLALYILGVFLVALVATALLLHLGFDLMGLLPQVDRTTRATSDAFALDTTFVLDLVAVGVSGVFTVLALGASSAGGHDHDHGKGWVDTLLTGLAPFAAIWLLGGAALGLIGA